MRPALFFFVLLANVSCSVFQKKSMGPQFASNIVIAHRGAFKKNGFPENSIAALREAIRLQCTGSEFDVRMSADDSLVINHDPHYNGLDIEKTNVSRLREIPLSNGEPLPSLRQYLLAGLKDNRHTRLVLEIKPSPAGRERGQLIARKCVNMVKELNAAAMTVYISFDYDILKEVVASDRNAITQYLNGDKTPEQLKADGIRGADYHFSVFRKNPEWITSAKSNGIQLNAWTVNTEEDMRWLIASGFDFITTNEPELLLELVKTVNK